MNSLIPLIPLLPLTGFLLLALSGKGIGKSVAGLLASATVGIAFLLSLVLFFDIHHTPTGMTYPVFEWFSAGNLHLSFGFLVDALTSVFLLVITGVGFLIHVYSIGYMHDDEGYNRFFAYLNLFVFFMLLLVMGDGFLTMFAGWEGVGLSSYLLIGFWYKNIDYSKAAKKAFVINRIGDLGFLLGMMLLVVMFGSLDYATIFSNTSGVNVSLLTIATMLLFVGAIGKSAQIPLFTWLPDAMAGPTPVSALIHAATMVTSGIYMIARSNALFSLTPITLNVILWIGLATAIMAAMIAIYQNDIKKILAYSTVSQLGLMFAALGAGAYTAGVFHVVTHAAFKALLFLGAGSVIHAMHGEQDIRKMGGLKKALPITSITFLIGTLAISGIPPFAGFFSKDQILAELLYQKGGLIFGIALLISLMTAYYMFRLYFLTFNGAFRGKDASHLHESPKVMTLPLIVLAVLSVIAGFVGIPHGIAESIGGSHFLDHLLSKNIILTNTHFTAMEEWSMIGGTLAAIAMVIWLSWSHFSGTKAGNEVTLSGLKNVIYNKFYIDELYEGIVTKPLDTVSGIMQNYIDRSGIDGMVNGIGKFVRLGGTKLRTIQTGNLGSYFLAMVLAMFILLGVSLL